MLEDDLALLDGALIQRIRDFLIRMTRPEQIAHGGGANDPGLDDTLFALEFGLHYLSIGHASRHHQDVELIHVGIGGALHLFARQPDGEIPLQPGREFKTEGKCAADDQGEGEEHFPVERQVLHRWQSPCTGKRSSMIGIFPR